MFTWHEVHYIVEKMHVVSTVRTSHVMVSSSE